MHTTGIKKTNMGTLVHDFVVEHCPGWNPTTHWLPSQINHSCKFHQWIHWKDGPDLYIEEDLHGWMGSSWTPEEQRRPGAKFRMKGKACIKRDLGPEPIRFTASELEVLSPSLPDRLPLIDPWGPVKGRSACPPEPKLPAQTRLQGIYNKKIVEQAEYEVDHLFQNG